MRSGVGAWRQAAQGPLLTRKRRARRPGAGSARCGCVEWIPHLAQSFELGVSSLWTATAPVLTVHYGTVQDGTVHCTRHTAPHTAPHTALHCTALHYLQHTSHNRAVQGCSTTTSSHSNLNLNHTSPWSAACSVSSPPRPVDHRRTCSSLPAGHCGLRPACPCPPAHAPAMTALLARPYVLHAAPGFSLTPMPAVSTCSHATFQGLMHPGPSLGTGQAFQALLVYYACNCQMVRCP